jgi:hypothetical protein
MITIQMDKPTPVKHDHTIQMYKTTPVKHDHNTDAQINDSEA